MIFKLILILTILGFIREGVAFPTTIDEFYQALHNQITLEPKVKTDACKIIANQGLIQYREAINCYNSFPLKESIRRDIMETLKRMLELYVFKDIIKSSKDESRFDNRDIDTELTRISNYKFDSEFEFHSFLKVYFNTLHDGHTGYSSDCYTNFEFRQPLPIYIHQGNEVRVLPEIEFPDNFIKKWLELGFNVHKYEGAQVLKINQLDPIEYMKLYSNFYIGRSRDVNSRLNLGSARVLLMNGNRSMNHGMFAFTYLPPLNSSVTYSLKLKDGIIIEVEAPYLVISPMNFNDSSSYYTKYCNITEVKLESDETKDGITEEREDPVQQSLTEANNTRLDDQLQLLSTGPAIESYKLGEGTGILVLTSFEEGKEDWYDGIYEAFTKFQQHDVTRLILDLSNNDGGYVCRGYNVLDGLFPNINHYPTDMRSSPLLMELTTINSTNSFSPLSYNQLDNTSYNATDAFTHSVSHSRGGSSVPFTPKFLDRCTTIFNFFPISFPPSSITIITNTICYSACSLFVNSLQQLHNVTTYSIGGDPSLPIPPPSSMAGGAAIGFNDLYPLWRNTSHYQRHLVRPLPGHVKFAVTYREAYSHLHEEMPLEFVTTPANYRLDYDLNKLRHPKFVWYEVVKRLTGGNSSLLLT